MFTFLKKLLHRWFFTYKFDLVYLCEGSKMPYKKYKNDAGYDLFISRSTKICVGEMVNVPTGIAIKSYGVPAWVYLTGRSSTLIRHGLIIDNGIIDDGYTGELCIKIYNPTKEDITLYPGMRVGQIIIMPLISAKFRMVERFKIKNHERGGKGFGSTGI